MFKCSDCGDITEPREPMKRIVTQTRTKKYSNGSTGWEITKEEAFCTECYEKVQSIAAGL